MRSQTQRWKIGHYSGKNFQHLGNYTATFTFKRRSVYFAIKGKTSAEIICHSLLLLMAK